MTFIYVSAAGQKGYDSVELNIGDIIYIHASARYNKPKFKYSFYVKTKITGFSMVNRIETPFGEFITNRHWRKKINGQENFYLPTERTTWNANMPTVEQKYDEQMQIMTEQEAMLYAHWILQHFDYRRLGLGDDVTTMYNIVNQYAT